VNSTLAIGSPLKDFQRDDGERLIFWPRIWLPAYLSSWITADSPPKVSIDSPSLHDSV
jgi:hypothetical protein